MTRVWTPYEIEIFMHHACSRAVFPRDTAPSYQQTLRGLADAGLLQITHLLADVPAGESGIGATEKGRIFLAMLTSTPLPELVAKWVDPRDGSEVQEWKP